MARGKGKTRTKLRISKPLLKGIVLRVALLLAIAIFLFQLTNLFGQLLFLNRLDETRAVAFRYTFQALPFECRDVRSNISGQKVVLLNITSQTQTHSLYSERFSSDEIKDVGILERNGKTLLVLWSSEVNDEKEYVVYGEFVDFYKFGTREKISVLLVQDYREFGLLDEVVSKHKFMLSQITIGLFVLTATCILALLGTSLWFVVQMGETQSNKSRA